jgi:hypothetical protein
VTIQTARLTCPATHSLAALMRSGGFLSTATPASRTTLLGWDISATAGCCFTKRMTVDRIGCCGAWPSGCFDIHIPTQNASTNEQGA